MCHKLGCVSTKPQPKQIKVSIQSPPQSKPNSYITVINQTATAPKSTLSMSSPGTSTSPSNGVVKTEKLLASLPNVKRHPKTDREVRISVLSESTGITRPEQSAGLILGQLPSFCEVINPVNNVSNLASFSLKTTNHTQQPQQQQISRANNGQTVSILTLYNHQTQRQLPPDSAYRPNHAFNVGQVPAIVGAGEDVDSGPYFASTGSHFAKKTKVSSQENSSPPISASESISGIPIKINKKISKSEPYTFTSISDDKAPGIPLIVEVEQNSTIERY